tara:strand:+ start:709 stop:1053 length:345 start_codon:yes stop_codon:yes gene_type:complete
MTSQSSLFDLSIGIRRRDTKRDKAAESQHRAEIYHQAQVFAKELAAESPDGTTHIDAVYRKLIQQGWDILLLGPAAGKIFSGYGWTPTGWMKSKRVTNNGRQIQVWKRTQTDGD